MYEDITGAISSINILDGHKLIRHAVLNYSGNTALLLKDENLLCRMFQILDSFDILPPPVQSCSMLASYRK